MPAGTGLSRQVWHGRKSYTAEEEPGTKQVQATSYWIDQVT